MLFAQAEPTSIELTTVSVEESTYFGLASGTLLALTIAILVLMFVAWWRVFEKAGRDGWKSLVPFLNTYTLFEISGRNGWMFLLLLIPFVNVVVAIMVAIDIAHKFGKSTTFGVLGLWLFSVVGYFMLGFDDSKYEGTAEPTVEQN